MRASSLPSLLLLVSICAFGTACSTQTDSPNTRVATNSATPSANGGTPAAGSVTPAATQTPSQTPLPAASPIGSPTGSPTVSASPLAKSTKVSYSVYKDAGGQWRWRLVAANNRIVADSGESYRNKQDCLAAIELIKNSKDAPVSEKP